MKTLTFLLLALIALTTPAAAVDVQEAQYEAIDAEETLIELPSEALAAMGGVTPREGDFQQGLFSVLEDAASKSGGLLRDAARSGALILLLALLTGLVGSLWRGGEPDWTELGGVLAISAAAVGSVGSFAELGTSTLDEMAGFSRVLLPTLTAIAAAGGAVSSAGVKYAATALFVDVLISLCRGVLLPLVYAYVAALIANAALGGDALEGAAKLLKWLATSLLALLTLAFVVYITVSGAVAGSADAAAARVAKTTISTILPVVGGMLTDAAASILSGASLLKNSVGVFGLVAVAAVSLVPFLRLGLHYLAYKAAAALSAGVAGRRLSSLIGGLAGAFGLIMGMTGSCAVMLYFSMISIIKVAGA